MNKANTHSNRDSSWLVLMLSFILGLLLCQTLHGFQQIESVTSNKTKKKNSAAETSQAKTNDLDLEPQLPGLSSESGTGKGKPIGSGVAEIVLTNEASQTGSDSNNKNSNQHTVSQVSTLTPLKPIPKARVPRRVPVQTVDQPATLIPQKDGLQTQYGAQTTDSLPVPSTDSIRADARTLQDPTTLNPSFDGRQRGNFVPLDVVPEPLGYGMIYDPERQINPWNPDARRDETVYNGGDRGKRAAVDSEFNLYNVNPQDTIGHFDTLDGRRLVTPSNEVAIYAPRFAAVRRVDGLIRAENRLRVGSMNEKKVLNQSESKDFSATTKQFDSIDRFRATKRASGLRETTRGVLQDNLIHLHGVRNSYEPFENLSLFRLGINQRAEEARLGLGMQSANVWQDNLGLQVSVKGAQPVIVNDVYKVQQLVRIDSDDKNAILRVCKVASKISARPGEPVDFTIRFDNLTGRPIGNVTIVDNLVGRLEYVSDSAECSLKANFSFETSESGSLVLRWEIIDPMPANSGGIIRFRCRVR